MTNITLPFFICFLSVSVTIGEDSLVAVVGVVGSGKSSLLSAVLGNMKKLEGLVNVRVSCEFGVDCGMLRE